MNFEPILTAAPIIQIHIAFALLALLTGPIALFRARRDRLHKVLGYVASVAMLGLAWSGLGIESSFPIIAGFGPIHLFCVLATIGTGDALYQIRRGDVARHIAAMQSVWFGALGVTGLITLLPGRVLNRALFGAPSNWGFAVIAVGFLGLWALWQWQQRRLPPLKTRSL